jgi:hypothetical protein
MISGTVTIMSIYVLEALVVKIVYNLYSYITVYKMFNIMLFC